MKELLFIGVCGAIALTGCVESNSTRMDIGGGVDLPSLSLADERPENRPDDGPSATGLARTNWRTVTVTAPVYGVASHPTYRTEWRMTATTHRQRGGEYPTASTALEETGGTMWDQRYEAFAAPFVYVGDLVMLVPRMVMTSPTSEVRETQAVYSRAPVGTPKRSGAGK